MEEYVVTREADMLAPKWLAIRINYTSVKFLYRNRDGAAILKGVRINDQTAKIGDVVCFDGKRLYIERR